MNLIDDSALHLHGLMKSVAIEAPERKLDPLMINAVCNCAKNVTNLMKLKLDIVKNLRK